MDIRINPDNKSSGYIRIINYPFHYLSTWRLILFMYFLCSFQNFYAILQQFGISKVSTSFVFCISTSISNMDLNVLPLWYTSATLRYPPLPAAKFLTLE